MAEQQLIGALEAGGTKMVCATGYADGTVLEREQIATTTPQETVEAVNAWFANKGIAALGIGAFGPTAVNPASPQYGKILETPKTAWRYFDLLGTIQNELNIPCGYDTIATLPGMFERTISCSSLSKTYSITGWRLGYTIAPAQITERIKKVHDFLTVGAAAPLQEAVVTALNFDDSYYQEVLNLYTAKRDLFCQGLDSIGLEHNVPQGAYYVMMDISEFGYDSDLDFCEDLASKVGVGAVPGSSFFREPVNHLIRLHFAKRDETLNAALENLKSLRDKIKPRG